MHAFEAVLNQGRAVARALKERDIPPTHQLHFEKRRLSTATLQPSTLGVQYHGWRLSGEIGKPAADPRNDSTYNYDVSGLLLRNTGDILYFNTTLSAGNDPEGAITEVPDAFSFSQVNDPRSLVDRLSSVVCRDDRWGFPAETQHWLACAGLQGLIALHDLQLPANQ